MITKIISIYLLIGFLGITVHLVLYSIRSVQDINLFEHGKITHAVIRKVDVSEDHHLKIEYYYQVEGREYVNDRICNDKKYALKTALKLQKYFSADTLISVYVDPINPLKSLYVQKYQKPLFPYDLWGLAIVLWVFWWRVFSRNLCWKKGIKITE